MLACAPACLQRRALRGAPASGGLVPEAGVSAPRPTHFLCWCKESKPRKHLEHNAACDGCRRPRSLRSSRGRARSRAAGARQGDLTPRRTSTGCALDACAQSGGPLPGGVPAAWQGRRVLAPRALAPHRGARYRQSRVGVPKSLGESRLRHGEAKAPSQLGERHRPVAAPDSAHASSAPAVESLHGVKSPCRAPAARDRARPRLERSERRLRQPPHAALYSRCFLAYFLCTSKDRHRGPHFRRHPCHTTRHAGPHRAVRELEVMRVGALPACRSNGSSARS